MTPEVFVSTTPEGLLGVALMHKQNTVIVLIHDGDGLGDLLGWALTTEAGDVIRTAVKRPVPTAAAMEALA